MITAVFTAMFGPVFNAVSKKHPSLEKLKNIAVLLFSFATNILVNYFINGSWQIGADTLSGTMTAVTLSFAVTAWVKHFIFTGKTDIDKNSLEILAVEEMLDIITDKAARSKAAKSIASLKAEDRTEEKIKVIIKTYLLEEEEEKINSVAKRIADYFKLTT